jgi:nucleoside-diphosphate-sugar epimerase
LKLCRKALPLPLGGIANRRSMIYAGNLADAVIRCLAHPDAAGRTYLVGDCEDVSTPELIRRVAGALGRPARLFAVPSVMLRLAGGVMGQSAAVARLLGSLQIDDGRIRRELGWTPPFAMLQGMEKMAAWFLSTGRS